MLKLLRGHKASSLPLGFYGNHYLRLTSCASTSRSRLRCTKVPIVYLKEACKRLEGISCCHGLYDRVAHDPHCMLAFNLQHSLKGAQGDAPLLASHQKIDQNHVLRVALFV